MPGHDSHTWGPHHAGLRLVECSTCTVVLHEPEAELPCAGDDSLVKQGRAARLQEFTRVMKRVARREAAAVPGVVDGSLSWGLWQIRAGSWPRIR